MLSLTQNIENISKLLWSKMKTTNKSRVAGALQCINKRELSLLHLCAQAGQKDLLLEIARDIPKDEVLDILLKKTPEGRTILDMCSNKEDQSTQLDQETVSELLLQHIIPSYGGGHPDYKELTYSDKQGKNLLHSWATTDFYKPIDILLQTLPEKSFQQMLFKKTNKTNSRPMMISALHGNKLSLELMFLHYIYIKRNWSIEERKKYDGEILHHKNSFGNTLLALVLQQTGRLEVPRAILLEMEKQFHDINKEDQIRQKDTEKNKKDLANCLKKHLKPSVEVQNALYNVENSLSKNKFRKGLIWFNVILMSLVIPIFLLFLDFITDLFLVKTYKGENCNKLNETYMICIANRQPPTATELEVKENITNPTCNVDAIREMPFLCSPLHLNKSSRFNYSLAFLISPWVFYWIEYCQSDYWADLSEVNKTFFLNNLHTG